MSKSEKQNSHEGTKTQGKSPIKFILLFIIVAVILLYHLSVMVSQPIESADRPVTAGSNFKPNQNSPARPAKTRQSTQANLSGGPSLPPDRFIGNHTGADYPDTMVLLDSIVEKLWQLESSGRLSPPDGDGGDAVGPLQLHIEVLLDVNKYFDFNFKPDDRKDLAKSKLIAKAYITMWLMENQEEIAVRISKGGPRGWRSESTNKYWEKYKNLTPQFLRRSDEKIKSKQLDGAGL